MGWRRALRESEALGQLIVEDFTADDAEITDQNFVITVWVVRPDKGATEATERSARKKAEG